MSFVTSRWCIKRGDAIYLQHNLDAITKVEQYLAGVDESMFAEQTLIQDGVIRQIEIIGEAAKQLTMELRTRYTHIPWRILPRCETNLFITTSV
jgi:uncharacterized protein with HEPN domain